MKKLRKIKKERGAITVMSALMMIVVLGFTALSIDIGLHNYLGAKLQNAVDSAATAVAANIDADESSLYDYAYEYLAKNGYDRTSDKYKDGKIKVNIEHKVSRTDASAYAQAANERAGSDEYSEYDFYITSGVYKITADVDDSTLFGNALGISSLHLTKTAYVKADANYEAFPEALKYSIFAGATKDSTIQNNDGEDITVGNEDYPGIDIQGNAGAGSNAGNGGANAFSTVVGIAERGINGAWDFIQNIMSWFGYTPNNNPLVNINVSEATFNNNAHSNSNIMIGVQALNASRVKDTDYSGNTTTYNQAANENTSTDTYSDADDYGQVRFTAYDDIKFGYSTYIKNKEFKNTITGQVNKFFNDYIKNRPELTRTYVQNQQCLQVTQHVINILDTMNLDGNISDNFDAAADNYFTANKAISPAMQQMVKAQGANITKKTEDGKTYIEIANQESIVYRVNQARAQHYLDVYVNNENVTGTTRAALKKSRFDLLTSQLGDNWDTALDSNGRLLYQNNGDAQSELTYPAVLLNKTYTDTEGHEHTYSYEVRIKGTKVDRNTDTIFTPSTANDSSYENNATYIGAKYATVRTFREQSEYINIPNLKPYFTRQINKSVNNATKTVTNINSGNWQGSAYGVADAVEKAVDEINKTSSTIKYEDNTFADTSENKTKYWGEGNEGTKKNYAYDVLFTKYYGTKANESSDNDKLYDLTSSNQTFKNFYNNKEYTLKHSTDTTFRGVKIFNDDKSLRTPDQILTEQFNAKFGGSNPEFGAQKIRKYYEDLSALEKPNTAVSAKEAEINNEYGSNYDGSTYGASSYRAQQRTVFENIRDSKRTTIDYDAVTPPAPGTTVYNQEVSKPTLPAANSVFLGGGGKASLNVAENNAKRLVFNTNIRTANQGYTPNANEGRLSSGDFVLPARANNKYSASALDVTVVKPDYALSSSNKIITENKTAINNYLNSNPKNINFDTLISTIAEQYSWTDRRNQSEDWLTRCDGDAGSSKKNYHKPNNVQYYQNYKYDSGRGFVVPSNYFVYYTQYVKTGDKKSFNVNSNGVILVKGDSKTDDKALNSADDINIRSGGFAVINGSVKGDNQNGNVTLSENAALFINGDLTCKHLTLAAGSVLYVTGNVTVTGDGENKGLNNNGGKLICDGTITVTQNGARNNSSGSVMYAGVDIDAKNYTGWGKNEAGNIINVAGATMICGDDIWANDVFTNNGIIITKNAENTKNQITNYGTLKATGDITSKKQIDNFEGATIICKGTVKGTYIYNNVATLETQNLTSTSGDIQNRPGDNSSKHATIKVNGTLNASGYWIYNSYSGYASGAKAYMHVNTVNNCGKIINYTNSYFYSNGTVTFGAIENQSGCELMASTIKCTGTVTNNGTMYATTSYDADGATTNYGYVYSGGTLEMSGLTNSTSCEVISLGDMTLEGTVSTANAKLECGGAIKGSGSISCNELRVLNGITANSITVSTRVKTNGNIKLSGLLNVATNANVSTYGSLEAGTIINRGIINVFGYQGEGGNIKTTEGAIINLQDIRCYGNITSKTDLSNGYYWVSADEEYRNDNAAIRCQGDMTVGNHLDNYGTIYLGTITEGSGTPNDGNLTVNGCNAGRDSVSNFGNIYACGDISCDYQIYCWGKSIYTLGNISACNSDGTNLLNLVGTNDIYVRGVVTSSQSGKHIYIHNPENVNSGNTTLSILGNGASAGEDCFNNKLEEFCNMQEGSRIYLGTGINITNSHSDATALYNGGRMYIFGEVNINTENGVANSVSLWGTFNYGDADYTEHSYSGITYCENRFNAPNTTVNVAGNHLLYIDGGTEDNTNNFTIAQLNMSNNSQFYTHDGAAVDGTVELTGSAVFNVLDNVSSSGIHQQPGGHTRVIAPNEVKLNGTVLSDLPDTVFGSADSPLTGANAIETPSLIGSGIRIKIFGDLIVNGNIELTGSALIVTGTVKCDNLLLNGANFVCGGNLTVKSHENNAPGYINAYNGSIARIDSQILTASNISADNASIYSAKGVVSASTITLSNAAEFVTRDSGDVQEAGASPLSENDDHNDHVNLSGAVNVSSGAKLYVNGNIYTSSVTANGASKVYGYGGIIFSGNHSLEIDTTTHLSENSIVFCGPDTNDNVNYDIYANGTLYLPPNKNFGRNGNSWFKLDVRKFGNVIIDSPVHTKWIKIGDQNDGAGRTSLVYTSGRLTISDCTLTNYGRLYSMGGTNITGCKNANPGQNTADYWFQDGSENFFGKLYDNSGNRITTLQYNGFYEGRGNVYLDCNLDIKNNCNWSEAKAGPNRYSSIYIRTGKTYLTGNVDLPTGSSIKTEQGTGIYVGGNLNMTSAIYNYGTISVYKKLNINYDTNEKRYLTDGNDSGSSYRKGISIKNGVDQTTDESKDYERVNTGAKFIVYNEGKSLSQDNYIIHLLGYIKNTGDMYFNANMNIEGYNEYERVYADSAFWNFVGANAHFAGYVYLNGNQLFNRRDGTFSCGGDLLFGGCIYNCGKLAAYGDISNHEYAKDANGNYTNQSLSCNGQSYWEVPMSGFNFSFCNGIMNDGNTNILGMKLWWPFDRDNIYSDATVYCGGKLQLGKGEFGDDANAGSMFNFGNIYVRNDVDVFTNGKNATHRVAIWDYNDTSMIVGGHVFGGGGIATGNGSLFMCGEEFRAKRSVKINANFRMQNWIADYITFNDKTSDGGNNILSPAYFYVGGNFYGNVVGKSILDNGQPDVLSRIAGVFGTDISHAVAWPENSSRDLDIYANTNMFVGGSFYSNAKIYAKENTSIVVAAKDSLYKSNGSLRDELYTNDLIASFKQWLDSNIRLGNGNNTPYAFVTYQLLDAWEASRIIVNGGMYVQDTCKIRDMAKVYANGKFKCDKYVEIGKALDGMDETEAKEEARRSLNDQAWKTKWLQQHPGSTGAQAEAAFMNRYKFDNAGYMYVGGDFDSGRYTKIYASTALKVKGDFRTTTYLTLRHDGQIYVGKKLRAGTSIDGGAYCQMYVNGSMQAVTENIKIRDQATVFVGGNMTALSYIELGKYDPNFDRGIQQVIPITEGISSQYNAAQSQDNDAGNPDQEINNGGTDAQDSNETTDNPQGGEGTGSDNLNENETSTQFSDVGEVDAEKQIYAVNEESEYSNDTSDRAVGAKLYIAGDVTTQSYIREYAFSRVISGGYVYSPRHITLRHNADFWVLPEVFGKITYDYTPYVPPEDTSRNWLEEIGYNIRVTYESTAHALKHAFTPKPGSIYSLGQLTLNTNASIFATYDVMCFGQTALKGDSLVYVGHDFDCWAPMYTFQMDTSSLNAFWTSMKANLGIVDGNTERTYKGFDTYDQYDKTRTYTIDGQTSAAGTYTRTALNPHPIIVYANNEINIATTTTMRGTYLIANRGNLNFTDLDVISSTTDVTPSQATALPNAFASYQHNINFFAMRGTLGALFYSPRGNTNLDGWYYDFYGSIVGKTVNFDAYYINVHRFNNWRTLDLQLATSSNVYLVSEDDYLYAEEDKNFNNLYGYEPTPDTSINQWAQPFFRGIDTSEVSEDEQNAGSTDVESGSDQLGNGGTPHNDQVEGDDD